LLFLVTREASLAEVARLTRVDLRRVHHHVTALHALGLVQIVQERPRAGRPINIYRAVSRAFFVPENLSPAEPAMSLAVELGNSLARMRAATRSGVIYEVDENGAARMRLVSRSSESAAPAEIWSAPRLSRSDALRLGNELANCVRRYAAKESRTGEIYLVHCALAPRRPSSGRRKDFHALLR